MIKSVWKCINNIGISPKRGMEQAEIIDTFWTYQNHADMTETSLRPITNSGIWIPMLAPTCSTMISSDEPRCQGFNQSRIQFPLSIGIALARDSIVGIPIPFSISLPASLFTRSVTHHPVINSLITYCAHYDDVLPSGPRDTSPSYGVTNPSLDSCQPTRHFRRYL